MTLTSAEPTRRRRWPVPRSLLIGIAPAVLFGVISAIRARPSDDYTGIGETLSSVVHSLVLPELLTGGVLAIIVTALGWWPIVWSDRRRGGPPWTLLAPGLILVVALARLPLVNWHGMSAQYFLLLGVGTLLVGVFEETMARGMLIAGLRRRLPELGVWAISCTVFGLLHLVNALAGQPLGETILQVIFAATFGSALYVARRLSRSLLAPILLHAIWDFGSIAATASGRADGSGVYVLTGLLGLLTIVVLLFSVVAGLFVALRDDSTGNFSRRWASVPSYATFALAPARDWPAAHAHEAGLPDGGERSLQSEPPRR